MNAATDPIAAVENAENPLEAGQGAEWIKPEVNKLDLESAQITAP